jgi:hypothetical protein
LLHPLARDNKTLPMPLETSPALLLFASLRLIAQTDAILPTDKVTHVSDHVCVIPGWP